MSAHRAHRFISRGGRVNVERQSIRYHHPRDWYHWPLTLRWPKMVAFVGLVYFTVNAFFALLYVVDLSGIARARPGSYSDYAALA